MPKKNELFEALRLWRDRQARQEGVQNYRVLSNTSLEAIALALPTTKESLCALKGIKEARFRKYGPALLALVREHVDPLAIAPLVAGSGTPRGSEIDPVDTVPELSSSVLTVSQFLDGLNLELSGMAARVRGEVTSADIRDRVVYFTLKDKQDESLLNCLVFRYQYEVNGVALEVGSEVVVEGVPDIYKPSGRLSLRVGSIEYAGEGALKQAYRALYARLASEGFFAAETKRPLPQLPERIALITSQDGAALGDFTVNLVRSGIHIDLYPTLVEGKRAVFDMLEAITFFNRFPERYDVLVIIRGGGSFESLQAFNTEALVRAIGSSVIPVLAGIGHERDVSLAALAADVMVSTPTATAKRLSQGWDEARRLIGHGELYLVVAIEKSMAVLQHRFENVEAMLREDLEMVLGRVKAAASHFQETVALLPGRIQNIRERLDQFAPYWKMALDGAIGRLRTNLEHQTARIKQYSPERALRLGYSLVRSGGRIIRDTVLLEPGDILHIQLDRGRVESKVSQVFSE